MGQVLLILVKVYEERELALRFGQPFLDYKRRTLFLFPRLGHAKGKPTA